MQTLKVAALGLVFVSAACCIYYYLLPEGGVSRTARRILSVFFLACVLSPLFSVFNALGSFASFSLPEETGTLQTNPGPLAAAGEAAVREAAEALIRAKTDVPFEIRISVHITETGGIDIERLHVRFEREFNGREDLAAALREALGCPVETEVENGLEETVGAAGAAAGG